MEIGKTHTIERVVTEDVTAVSYGNAGVAVLATPALVGFCELAALECMAEVVEPAQATVGTMVNIRHLAATPLGMRFTITAKLIEQDRRRFVFELIGHDEKDQIVSGTHERFLVNLEKFLAGVAQKREG